jgi:hypothetical protein
MKTAIKIVMTSVFTLVAAAIPFTLFYLLWSWTMTQIPMANEWSGLIKVLVTFVMIGVGGGATLALAFLGALLSATLVGVLTGLIK